MHACNLRVGRLRQEDRLEFQFILGYIAKPLSQKREEQSIQGNWNGRCKGPEVIMCGGQPRVMSHLDHDLHSAVGELLDDRLDPDEWLDLRTYDRDSAPGSWQPSALPAPAQLAAPAC